MMGLGGGLRKILSRTLFVYLSLAAMTVGTHGQTTKCSANTVPDSNVKFNVTVDDYSHCVSVELSPFTNTLWYQRTNSTSGTTLSVILRVPKQNPAVWYGMGFNSAAQMVGSSAIIFWLNSTSQAPISNTYYLSATAASGVNVDHTRLTYKSDPQIIATSTYLYLAFEVENVNTDRFNYQVFAIGASSNIPKGAVIDSSINEHQVENAFQIDFTTNNVAGVAVPDTDKKARTHGILNIIGWGFVLPHGAIVARYFRSFDPHWFYVHATLQIIGYIFIVIGLATGFKLLDDVHKLNPTLDADTHRALALLVFAAATIQITAILVRPKQGAKLRRYWSWGHAWTGRIALVIAIVNIFVGINLAKGGKDWKLGYGIPLAFEILLVIVLEAWLWIKYSRSKNEPRIPQTAMENRGPANGTAATAPAPHYDSPNWDSR